MTWKPVTIHLIFTYTTFNFLILYNQGIHMNQSDKSIVCNNIFIGFKFAFSFFCRVPSILVLVWNDFFKCLLMIRIISHRKVRSLLFVSCTIVTGSSPIAAHQRITFTFSDVKLHYHSGNHWFWWHQSRCSVIQRLSLTSTWC